MEGFPADSQVHEHSIIKSILLTGGSTEEMTLQEFKSTLNEWGRQKVPFLFWIDFEMEKPQVHKLSEVDSKQVLFNINGVTNIKPTPARARIGVLKKHPIPFSEYQNKLNKVMYHLHYGDTFLANLTVKTEVETTSNLEDMFHASNAKYKLFVRNQFLVFSPETFVRISNNRILSNPMKGTMDASIPGAADIILNNKKEEAEHITIVDLIRNDLSMVSNNVRVDRFRYLDEIRTNHKALLQVSSEIVGDLPVDYSSRLGDIIATLLPAGSVSGAPKRKTLEIISEAEQEKRGYYTGVVGYFDGENLDSGVMIRFIEQAGRKLYYRSGGGITTQSEAETEYQEVLDKVYVPVD